MKRLLSFFSEMIRHQKNWYAKWHAWAGIFAGSILIIVSLTGTLLVFEEELDVWFYPELFSFEEKSEKLNLSEAFNKISEDNPTIRFSSIFEFPLRNGAYMAFFQDGEEHEEHNHYQAIIDPYTGTITGMRIYEKSVMGFIRNLHRTLLIPTVGRYIVGIASLFMVILMITGLRLWIPRHWKLIKERLTVKKGASFKRQNYDLHNSLGFYFSPFITLISMTGVAITFSNFVILALFIVNFQSPQSIGEILGKTSTYEENRNTLTIEEILMIAQEDMPHARIAGFTVPSDSLGAFNVNFKADGISKTGDLSFTTFDQYTGERLLNTHKDFANSAKIPVNWLTSIHYGTFGGMPTRILALLASLVAPILFITGFIIWWGRWKKRKRGNYDKDDMLENSEPRQPTGKKVVKPVIPKKQKELSEA